MAIQFPGTLTILDVNSLNEWLDEVVTCAYQSPIGHFTSIIFSMTGKLNDQQLYAYLELTSAFSFNVVETSYLLS